MRGSDGPNAIARNGEFCGDGGRLCSERFSHPSSVTFTPGVPGLHKILRIEVGARRVGRSSSVHDGEMALLPQRLKWRQRRMQSEEAIEIDHGLSWNVDAGPHRIVLRLAVRNNNVEPVGRAALEDDDETLVTRALDRSERGARKKAGHGSRPDDGERAVAKKDATRDRHWEQLLASS